MMKQIFLKRGSFYLLIVFLKRDTLEKTYEKLIRLVKIYLLPNQNRQQRLRVELLLLLSGLIASQYNSHRRSHPSIHPSMDNKSKSKSAASRQDWTQYPASGACPRVPCNVIDMVRIMFVFYWFYFDLPKVLFYSPQRQSAIGKST